MKTVVLLIALSAIISGCAWTRVTPNSADRTSPRLQLDVYYERPDLTSPKTRLFDRWGEVNHPGICLYVKSPFRMMAIATDEGGISRIAIGHIPTDDPPDTRYARVRTLAGDIVAGRAPNDRRLGDGDDAFIVDPHDNPGLTPGGAVAVDYRTGPVYDGGYLSAVYEIVPGHDIAFHADAKNFSDDRLRQMSQVAHFYVRLEEPGKPAGTTCPVPQLRN